MLMYIFIMDFISCRCINFVNASGCLYLAKFPITQLKVNNRHV